MNEECIKIQRAQRNKKIRFICYQILLFVLFLGLWELLASTGIINTFLFSKPSAVFKLLIKYIKGNQLMHHVYISVYETILGIIIGSSLGIIIASILWYFETLSQIMKPFLNILNSLPKTALAPIMIIWAGTNVKGIVVVAISILIVITILSTYQHYLNVDKEKIKMMQSFKATKLQIFLKLIFPSNLGNLLSVVKINIGMSWVGVIVGEFLVSREGLGYLIMYGGQVFKLDLVMMGVFVLAICAFLMYVVVEQIEKILLKGRN